MLYDGSRTGTHFLANASTTTATAIANAIQPKPVVKPAMTEMGARMVMPISNGAKPT